MAKAEKKRESWGECRKTIRRKWHVPVVFVEWMCWRVSPFLEQLAFLKVLEYLGRLAVLIAVIFYFTEAGDRRRSKHYQAWQVINSAQGQTGSGGRIDALQDLNKDKVSLASVDISNANLRGIELENANLYGAMLSGAHLYEANLSGAFLHEANFSGAFLCEANLSGADLSKANLSEANLYGADLSGANLSEASLFGANLSEVDLQNTNCSGADLHNANLSKFDLQYTDFSGADLQDTDLSAAGLYKANLSEARLFRANLSGADLRNADLSGANLHESDLSGANLSRSTLRKTRNWTEIGNIKLANICGVKEAPEGFITWAKKRGAVSIRDPKEWEKLIREKKKQEAEDSGRDQEKTGEK